MAGVWHGDKRVDGLHVVKRYAERDEIHIKIERKASRNRNMHSVVDAPKGAASPQFLEAP